MGRFRSASAVAASLVLAATLLGCYSRGGEPGETVSPTAVADFGLLDVNPASTTGGRTVHVRDYVGQVSAWYFGHAT